MQSGKNYMYMYVDKVPVYTYIEFGNYSILMKLLSHITNIRISQRDNIVILYKMLIYNYMYIIMYMNT